MKKLMILLAFVVLWAVWSFGFPYYLRWLEGISFFSTLPDFTMLHVHFPGEIFRYIGTFFLQFYAVPAVGAALQALFPLLVVIGLHLVVGRIFKNAGNLLWISFLALPAAVYLLSGDTGLETSSMLMAMSVFIAVIAAVAALFTKPSISLPKVCYKPWLSVAVPAAAICASVALIFSGPINRQHNDLAQLEYLGENGRWEEILDEVSPKDAQTNELKRRYALLALSETGKLAEHAFRYGFTSASDFYFETPSASMEFTFNILFYKAIGMQNPIVYHSYQQATLSMTGLSFDSVRALADAYLELKDYELARKYIDILSHTTCHGRWVRERMAQLDAIKDVEQEYGVEDHQFVLQSFVKDMYAMAVKHPDDRKISDYLLCSVMAEKNGNRFMDVFNVVAPSMYPDGRNIPRLYQEALCPLTFQIEEGARNFHIDEDIWNRFMDFTDLMGSGKASVARKKYYDSYWTYVFF